MVGVADGTSILSVSLSLSPKWFLEWLKGVWCAIPARSLPAAHREAAPLPPVSYGVSSRPTPTLAGELLLFTLLAVAAVSLRGHSMLVFCELRGGVSFAHSSPWWSEAGRASSAFTSSASAWTSTNGSSDITNAEQRDVLCHSYGATFLAALSLSTLMLPNNEEPLPPPPSRYQRISVRL